MQSNASELGIDAESAQWLLSRHGTRTTDIFQRIEQQPQLAHRITPSVPLIYADLIHCAQFEMVMHLDDLLRRRMPLLILTKLSRNTLEQIAHSVSDILQWDSDRITKENGSML